MTFRPLTVSCLVLACLLVPASVAAEEVEEPGSIVIKEFTFPEGDGMRCIYATFLVFDDEEDVMWRRITYFDNLFDSQETRGIAPPFDDDINLALVPDGEFDAGAGEHQIELSILSVGEPPTLPGRCEEQRQLIEGRFEDPLVVFDKILTISGRVHELVCSELCEISGIAGVTIKAVRKKNGKVFKTTTDEFGEYRLEVPKSGVYKVKAKSPCLTQNAIRAYADGPTCSPDFDRFFPRSERISVNAEDIADVDFERGVTDKLVIKMKNKRFKPKGGRIGNQARILIRDGGTIVFKNVDRFFYGAFSVSSGNEFRFDRIHPKRPRRLTVQNDTGTPQTIDIFDPIHPRMNLVVIVVPRE